MTISRTALETTLSGVRYPAARDELLAHADNQGADDMSRHVLASVSDREYADAADVMGELGNVSREI